jgi:hypothetical protein
MRGSGAALRRPQAGPGKTIFLLLYFLPWAACGRRGVALRLEHGEPKALRSGEAGIGAGGASGLDRTQTEGSPGGLPAAFRLRRKDLTRASLKNIRRSGRLALSATGDRSPVPMIAPARCPSVRLSVVIARGVDRVIFGRPGRRDAKELRQTSAAPPLPRSPNPERAAALYLSRSARPPCRVVPCVGHFGSERSPKRAALLIASPMLPRRGWRRRGGCRQRA